MRQLAIAGVMGLLLIAARTAEGRIEGEAVVGRPFGVAQVSISGLDIGVDVNRVAIEEKNGRAFYPAVSQGVFGRLIGPSLGGPRDRPALKSLPGSSRGDSGPEWRRPRRSGLRRRQRRA